MKLSRSAGKLFRKRQYGRRSSIQGVERLDLPRFIEDGGSMTELARLSDGLLEALAEFRVAQINYSTVEAGTIKGLHVHLRQTDVWFVPPEDRLLLVLADVREGSPTEGNQVRMILGDGTAALIRIPPGVAHGCRNLGRKTARIVYFTDLHFSPDPERTDEGRLPWDFLGAEIWETSRE